MSELPFDLYFEYHNEADALRAHESDRKWRQKVEEAQKRQFYRIISKVIARVGIRRLA